MKSRYYDPEVGRFITIDDISYLDPESINGLNLYAYCGNNPVMRVDENGTDWRNPFTWFEGLGNVGKIILGSVLFIGAVLLTVATGGALAPVIIGFIIGVTTSTVFGGLGAVIASGGDWSQFGQGALNGFADGVLWGGIFAFAGAAIRGIKYVSAVKNKNYDALAKLFTHNKMANKVMLGKYDGGGATSYIVKAGRTHTYFNMPTRIFNNLAAKFGDDIWLINQAFLNQQIGKHFIFHILL